MVKNLHLIVAYTPLSIGHTNIWPEHMKEFFCISPLPIYWYIYFLWCWVEKYDFLACNVSGIQSSPSCWVDNVTAVMCC